MANVDMVNHPPHYNHGKIEVIKIIEDQLTPEEFRGYLKGQVLKYVTRERFKNGVEDLAKARWYQDYLLKFLAKQSKQAQPRTDFCCYPKDEVEEDEQND